jgi:ferritin-like metal-binding protein YciE
MKNSEKSMDKPVAPKNGKNTIVTPAKDAAAELRDFFIDSLKDIYWAENALVGALPKMAANATSASLAGTITEHIAVTKNQVARLDKVFGLLGEKAEGKKCEAMAGLLKEGDSILEETMPGAVRDAGIIAASQKIEHYEIATYGTLCAFAKTLAEEKEADCLLNDVALNTVNIVAAG